MGMKKECIVELTEEEADELMDEHWVGELVRCKDCKHRFDGDTISNFCEVLMDKAGWITGITVDPDWFCADGERR